MSTTLTVGSSAALLQHFGLGLLLFSIYLLSDYHPCLFKSHLGWLLTIFFHKNKPHLSFWIGTILSIMGVFFMSYVAEDPTVSYIGDLLAVLGGIFGALYLSIGQSSRRGFNTNVWQCDLLICSLFSFLCCLFTGDNLIPTSNQDWAFLLYGWGLNLWDILE